MTGPKTNERPGTRAVLRHSRMSSSKARQVLDLIRGKDVDLAEEILRSTPREAARVISKVLASAVANARNNDGIEAEELFVSACFADEGTTLKRWRPRARGRATRIRKRTTHITVIVSRLPEDRLEHRQARRAAVAGAQRARRVAASRGEETVEDTEVKRNRAARRSKGGHDHDHDHDDEDSVADEDSVVDEDVVEEDEDSVVDEDVVEDDESEVDDSEAADSDEGSDPVEDSDDNDDEDGGSDSDGDELED